MSKYKFTKPAEISQKFNGQKYELILVDQKSWKEITTAKNVSSKIITESDMDSILSIAKMKNFEAKCGESVLVLGIGKTKKSGVIIHGLGEVKISPENKEENLPHYQNKGGRICDFLKANKIQSVYVNSENISVNNDLQSDISIAVACGIVQKSYSFSKYLTTEKRIEKLYKLEDIAVSSSDEKQISEANKTMESIFMVRDLGNEPANILYPEFYAEIISESMAAFKNVKVEVLDKKKMEKLGMESLLGVSLGSDKEPKMVIVKYTGNKDSKEIDLALVGKGVTFDCGGISIKPANGMEDMKDDMAGSAVCFASIYLMAARNAKVNAICAVGLVENSINGSAQRPGDIVKSMSGQTIEVLNTDAEGRLVLADVLYYTKTKYKPETILDFATLTGAIRVALGSEYAGLFSNNDELSKDLEKSGIASGEKCWRLPIGPAYDKLLDSPIADIKNISGTGGAGSITAAQFLHRFIDGHTKWAHLDIAATGCIFHSPITLSQNGASGFGIKFVDKFIRNTIEK